MINQLTLLSILRRTPEAVMLVGKSKGRKQQRPEETLSES